MKLFFFYNRYNFTVIRLVVSEKMINEIVDDDDDEGDDDEHRIIPIALGLSAVGLKTTNTDV